MEQFYSPKDGYFDDDYYLKDHQGDLPSHLLLKGRKTEKYENGQASSNQGYMCREATK